MNWGHLRHCAWVDTRANFVAQTPPDGSLLDLGSSDGATLNHLAELRPDLRLFAVDLGGTPEKYPVGCKFHRANLEKDRLPWPDQSLDAITCMHLIEHLTTLEHLLRETARLLKPGGRAYFETPHPRTLTYSSPPGTAAGTFTLNFFDDLTHVRPVSIGGLAELARAAGLETVQSGTSRNWLFALSYPFLWFSGPSRKKFTAQAHWLGWSAYLVVKKTESKSGTA